MANYSAQTGSPELASIRARAAAILQADLARGKVTTKSGTYSLGKGVIQGNVPGFDITKVDPRRGISRSEMFAYTGNVSRDMPKVQQLIQTLENNKAHIYDTQPRDVSFTMENVGIIKPTTLTEQVQERAQVLSIAPRIDSIDVLAPSLLPAITPYSSIPTNAPPNNLIDVSAESGDSIDSSSGDIFLPDDAQGDYTEQDYQEVY